VGYIVDVGGVADTLLASIGGSTLTVRCPGCSTEIELSAPGAEPVTVMLRFAGRSSTWRSGDASSDAPKRA
jgi:hypothetical protein